MKLPVPLFIVLLKFTSIFRSGSEILDLQIRMGEKLRILADPNPRH
jgi:hypothetical protein